MLFALGPGAGALFSLEHEGSAHSDEEPMDCMDSLSMEIRPGETGVVDLSRLPDKVRSRDHCKIQTARDSVWRYTQLVIFCLRRN